MGQGLLRALSASGSGCQFLAWIPRSWDSLQPTTHGGIELRRVRAGALSKLFAENGEIRVGLRTWRAERLLSLGDTSVPGCSVPHLLLVQQPYLAYSREELGFDLPLGFRAKLALMDGYFRLGLSHVDHFTVQSRAMQTALSKRWNIPLHRISVVPSAVDFDAVPTSGPMPIGKPYVCYVASAAPHKNHDLLADMIVHLSERDIVCAVTVRPDGVPRLMRRARATNCTSRFMFLGPVQRPKALQLLKEAVAVVVPSRLESFGLTYYEAMSLGRPIVAADLPFAREACGDAALYADPNSGEDFAAKVSRILDSPSLAKELGERARRRFAEVAWSWSDVARAYLDLLEKLER